MILLDIINEIKEKDFTDDKRLWLQAIGFNIYDSQRKKSKRLFYDFDDNPEFESEYGNLIVDKYKYRLDESYISFVVIECDVLLEQIK